MVELQIFDGTGTIQLPSNKRPSVVHEGTASPLIRPFGVFGSFRRPFTVLNHNGQLVYVNGTKAQVLARFS
jgi:hypothetical protein